MPARATHFTVVPGVNRPGQAVLNPATNKLYVFGDQGVAIIDALTKTTIKYLNPPVAASFGWNNIVIVNQAKNKVYVSAGQIIYVIDGATDSVTLTATFPTNILLMAFNPVNNKLYIDQTFNGTVPQIGQVLAVDGDSLVTLAAIPSTLMTGIGAPYSNPSGMLLNPATNRLYVAYSRGVETSMQIINSVTDSIVTQTTCDALACHFVFAGGVPIMGVNPVDNSMWMGTDTTESGFVPCHPQGTDPSLTPISCPFPAATTFYRVDGATNQVATQFRTFGSIRSITGIDPLNGRIYGIATRLPEALNPVPGTSQTSALQLVAIDPANPVLGLVSIDGSNLATVPGATFNCGTGLVGAANSLGIDIAHGNVYYRCDATSFSKSSVIATRTTLTPTAAGVFPPENLATFVKQVATGATGTLASGTGETIRSLDSSHVLAFPAPIDNAVVLMDNASLTTSIISLRQPVVVPDFIITVRLLDTVGNPIPNVPVSIVNGSVNSSGFTGATGQFSVSGVLSGTYTVSYAAAGLIPVGASSQTVGVAADTSVNFAALTSPVKLNSVTLGALLASPGSLVPASVQLNQPAPPGGIVISLSASNSKVVKTPATVSIPAGQSLVNFSLQANGVGSATASTVTATYTGAFAPGGTSAISPALTAVPVDSLHVTKASWSKSTGVLTLTATSTNPASALSVILANNGLLLGTMTSLGGGNFTFQTNYTASTPSSVNVKSNLGGSTGQGLTIVP